MTTPYGQARSSPTASSPSAHPRWGRGQGWIPTGQASRRHQGGALGLLRAGRCRPRDGDRRRGGRPTHAGLRRHRIGSSGSPDTERPDPYAPRPRLTSSPPVCRL